MLYTMSEVRNFFWKFHVKVFIADFDIVCESRKRNFTEILKLKILFNCFKNWSFMKMWRTSRFKNWQTFFWPVKESIDLASGAVVSCCRLLVLPIKLRNVVWTSTRRCLVPIKANMCIFTAGSPSTVSLCYIRTTSISVLRLTTLTQDMDEWFGATKNGVQLNNTTTYCNHIWLSVRRTRYCIIKANGQKAFPAETKFWWCYNTSTVHPILQVHSYYNTSLRQDLHLTKWVMLLRLNTAVQLNYLQNYISLLTYKQKNDNHNQ